MKSRPWPSWSFLEPPSAGVAETGPLQTGSDDSRRRTPRPLFWGLFLAFFLLDQWTKRWILGHGEDLPVPLIPGLLSIVSVRNTGIVFGLFAGWNWVWVAVGVIFLFTGFWIGRKIDWGPWSTNGIAALLASGAAGNIADRVLHGFVVDFIDVYIDRWHWPSFNVADSCLSMASLWLIFRFGLVSRR